MARPTTGEQVGPMDHRVDRRVALRSAAAVGIGITAATLPRAAAASSTEVDGDTSGSHVSPASLLLHLDAGDANSYAGSGATWTDLSGRGHHGTIGSGVTFVAASGGAPAHFRFAGTAGAVVDVNGGAPIVFPPQGTAFSAYSKLVWFRRERINDYDNLLSTASTTTHAQHFLYFSPAASSPSRLVTAGNNTGFTRITTNLETTVGTWTFAAVTYSTAFGFDLYAERAPGEGWSTASPHTITDGLAVDAGLSFQLGGYGGGALLKGDIATALAYDRALTQQEISAYYDATVARFYPGT
jgi:hypothetical protein